MELHKLRPRNFTRSPGMQIACGGNMTYSDLCCQINHFDPAGSPTDHPALVSPDADSPRSTRSSAFPTHPLQFCKFDLRRIFFPAANYRARFRSFDAAGSAVWKFQRLYKTGG